MRPRSRDAKTADTKLRSISADNKRKKFLNTKKSLLANFQHDCLTTGLRTVRQIHDFCDIQYCCKGIKCKICKQIFCCTIKKLFGFGFEDVRKRSCGMRKLQMLNCGQFPRTRKEKSFLTPKKNYKKEKKFLNTKKSRIIAKFFSKHSIIN